MNQHVDINQAAREIFKRLNEVAAVNFCDCGNLSCVSKREEIEAIIAEELAKIVDAG